MALRTSEYENFIDAYKDLEYDRSSRRIWLAFGVGGEAVGAVVGLAAHNPALGSVIASLTTLAVIKPLLYIQDSINSGKRELASLVRRYDRDTDRQAAIIDPSILQREIQATE